jgi:hypothetical protein
MRAAAAATGMRQAVAFAVQATKMRGIFGASPERMAMRRFDDSPPSGNAGEYLV